MGYYVMSYNSLTSSHTLTVQKQTETTGDGMGVVRQWTDVGTVLGRLQPASPQYLIQFRQAGQEITHTFYLNEKPDPVYDNSYRFIFEGRIFLFRGFKDTDESARSPLVVSQIQLFEAQREQTID